MRRSEAKHNPGQPTPPRWHPSGRRRLLPPATWPPAGLLRLHPLPVDLSCLGDEHEVSLRRPLADSESVGLSSRKAVFAWVSADGDDFSPSVFPASSSCVLDERRARRLRLQLKESWERLVPSVKLRCGLKAVHPDVSVPLADSKAKFYEI